MEHEEIRENENDPVSWGKAYLYAFGWLIAWGALAVPTALVICSIPGNNPLLYVLLIGLILSVVFTVQLTKRIHHSWRVAIALLVELAILSGLSILLLAMAVMSAARHPV